MSSSVIVQMAPYANVYIWLKYIIGLYEMIDRSMKICMFNHHETLILDQGFEHLYIFFEFFKMDDTETVKVYM